jgi:dTDP-4-dehydrorhamnose 3,5-epimerase
MIRTETTALPGVMKVVTKHLADSRGFFAKTIHADIFRALGLRSDFTEEYYSISKKNVLRGLHFQTPPFDHAKYVTCLRGEILDVVVDIRKGSPTFGRVASFELSESEATSIYIPSGFAHGFLAKSEDATVLYRVTSVYAPENDAGILWSSVDFKWPVSIPIVSDRDAGFAAISDFKSPFLYDAGLGK